MMASRPMGRSVLASGELGQHNGLPATIVVSTTLTELDSGAGQAVTAGGTLLPMTDVIRMASHAFTLPGDLRPPHPDPAVSGSQPPPRLARAAHCVARPRL